MLSVDHPLNTDYEKDSEFQKFKEECNKTGTLKKH